MRIPQLQRDAFFGDYMSGAIQQNMTPHLTIANYQKLEHTQTLNGWMCRVSIQQPDSYRFAFYKDVLKGKTCRVELKLNREGQRLYDPYTFANEDKYRVYVHYDSQWNGFGWIKKDNIIHKSYFLHEIEKVCEEYKVIALRKYYDSLPFYKRIWWIIKNYINNTI